MNDIWWQSVTHLAVRVAPLLDEARGLQEAIVDAPSCHAALVAFDRLERLLDHPRAAVALLARHHPDEAVRRDARDAHEALTGFVSELLRTPAVLGALQQDGAELDGEARVVRDHLIEICRRAGAERPPAERDELASLQALLVRVGALYRRNLSGPPPVLRVDDEGALDGLSPTWRATHVSSTRGTWTVRLAGGVGTAVLSQCHDEATRQQCWEALSAHGWPDNGPVLRQLLGARAEVAQCLGFDHWAALEVSITMAEVPGRVATFLRRADAAARAAAADEREASVGELRPWNRLYGRERVGGDSGRPRGGPILSQVLRGLRELLVRTLGWEVQVVEDVAAWVPGIEAWELACDGGAVGRVYLDLTPRAGKPSRATTMRVRTGVAGQVLPEVAVIASCPRDAPMGHEPVVALCHELGHAVHHLAASSSSWIGLNGIPEGRDVAELAPQLFEAWAWDAEVLQALGWDEAEITRLLQAERRTRASRTMRQLLYAAYSVGLHSEAPDRLDLDAFDAELFERYGDGAEHAERLYAHFPHLVAYGATYFAYEWARAVSRDILVQLGGPASRPGALVPFVDGVLRRGKSGADAAAITELLGRPWSVQAYVEWLEEA